MWRRAFIFVTLICCFSVSASAAVSALTVEREVYAFLTEELDLPISSACGILANIENESAFNPNAVGDNGTSYGLCQWHEGRYSALMSYCRGMGLDYRTVEGQMQYLRFELENNYPDLLGALRGQKNDPDGAYRAGYLWCVEFERPSNMEVKAVNRGTLAKGKYWSRYHNIFADQEEEEPLTPEEVLEIVIEHDVTIPQPPQTEETVPEEESEEPAVHTRLMEPFRPISRPVRERPKNPALSFAVAVLFGPKVEPKERFRLETPAEMPAAV